MNTRSLAQNRGEVFDRPLHLAGVLDNAADELNRTWFGYEWNDRTRCNCGVVARQILQADAKRLRQMLPPIYDNGVFLPTWREMVEAYCPETGMAQNEVFRTLFAAGLQREDFDHLENLSHPQILARLTAEWNGDRPVNRSRKADVVAYLRAWALGIEELRDRQLELEWQLVAPATKKPAAS